MNFAAYSNTNDVHVDKAQHWAEMFLKQGNGWEYEGVIDKECMKITDNEVMNHTTYTFYIHNTKGQCIREKNWKVDVEMYRDGSIKTLDFFITLS
jgi:hypothetical protein